MARWGWLATRLIAVAVTASVPGPAVAQQTSRARTDGEGAGRAGRVRFGVLGGIGAGDPGSDLLVVGASMRYSVSETVAVGLTGIWPDHMETGVVDALFTSVPNRRVDSIRILLPRYLVRLDAFEWTALSGWREEGADERAAAALSLTAGGGIVGVETRRLDFLGRTDSEEDTTVMAAAGLALDVWPTRWLCARFEVVHHAYPKPPAIGGIRGDTLLTLAISASPTSEAGAAPSVAAGAVGLTGLALAVAAWGAVFALADDAEFD